MDTVITHTHFVPLPLFSSHFGYSALLDDDDQENPITSEMIEAACEEASDALFWFVPERTLCNGLLHP